MKNKMLQKGKIKESIMNRQFLFMMLFVLGIFLTSIRSNAQTTIQVGGVTRQMLVFASGVTPGRPLMISMHGLNQTMTAQYQSGMEAIGAANNFVVVYPQAINNSWDLSGMSDINFILAIIDKMYYDYGIDRDRVYLHGFSMGGMMSYYAATKIANKIAAIAPVSGFLMSGPNTNSSRPIPIIHAHGVDDTFVPYSNVMTHMNAWATRNGCPASQLTSPYPADNSAPGSSKRYWGPGKDGVEMVFLSLGGVGHLYSNYPLKTSQEIWDFCKKYSLKYGLSEFKYASVTDNDPKQIKIVMTSSIADSSYFTGFTVKVDNMVVPIDSVILTDTSQLSIYLSSSILNSNDISVFYGSGNLVSSIGRVVTSFGDTLVSNLLNGSSPKLLEVKTNKTGDTLIVRFTKKMLTPLDISSLTLNANYNGPINVSLLQTSFYKNDSTVLAFSLDTNVYRDYALSFTYSGNNVAAFDSGMLKPVTFPVTNFADGLPVQIVSGKIKPDAITLVLDFQKPITLTYVQSSSLILKVNGIKVYFSNYSVTNNTVQITLTKNIHYGDVVTISYTPGNIKAPDNGLLQGFINFPVLNEVNTPTWIQMPGKVEAESFSFKSGMQTQTTSDAGGGLNLSNISDGNWAEYTIENNSSQTSLQIAFRVASTSANGVIDFYLDNKNVGKVYCPNTGGWQVYQSVVKSITIAPGQHYLKMVATKGGFNLNYMNVIGVTGVRAGINETNTVTIYPNPASDELVISSADFKPTRIDIFDLTGNKVVSQSVGEEPVLYLPVHLPNGMYFVEIGNETEFEVKKIIITNK